jgi:hypothetical protein
MNAGGVSKNGRFLFPPESQKTFLFETNNCRFIECQDRVSRRKALDFQTFVV